MTSKEKAIELFNKFKDYCSWGDFEDEQDFINNVKQCALVAVDEILKAQPSEKGMIIGGTQTRHLTIDYWEKVNQEIKNL